MTIGRRPPSHVPWVESRGVEGSLLQESSHLSIAAEKEENAREIIGVPAWVTRIEPEGDLGCRQRALAFLCIPEPRPR
jgi:hypothetical protein